MNKVYTLLLLILVTGLSGPNVFAQDFIKIKRGDFKTDDKEGFREAWKSVKEANDLFKEGEGTFREAREYYLDAYDYNPDNAALNYMIGVCYVYTDNKYEASDYLDKAYEKDPEVSETILLMRARAYHLTYKFDEAIEEYSEYKNTLKRRQLKEEGEQIDNYIQQCRHGSAIMQEPKNVIIQNIGSQVNSQYDDYLPVIDANDSVMFFTSRRPASKKDDRFILDNKFYEDVYRTVKENGEWRPAQRLPKKVLGRKNQSNVAALGLSNDLNKIYLYMGEQRSGDIYFTQKKGEKWKRPKKVKGKINSSDKESSLAITSDGQKMYFVSTKEKKSFGGADIYISTKNKRGKWNKPVNIGPTINTGNNEIAVSLSENDSILFFSSDGHNTMGGFDVFKSTLRESGEWSKPENIGYPINTPDDDLFFTPIGNGRTGYYSSIRESGEGRKDIYKVITLGSKREMALSIDNEFLSGFIPQYEDLFIVPPSPLDMDTSIIIRGTVKDKETGDPIAGAQVEIKNTNNHATDKTITDNSGFYKVSADEPGIYGIEIIAEGYMYHRDEVDLTNNNYSDVVERNYELETVEVGDEVTLRNVYFETGKATLKPESYEEIDRVVKLMKSNPNMRIEIAGHTDIEGSLNANMRMSRKRAKAVVNYIQDQGVDKSRLESEGYAYTKPIAPNNTVDGRAKNRRVEFKILNK